MKKLFALLSLTAFLAVSVNAQTPSTNAPDAKKETVSVKADSKAPAHSCCVKANTACCKNNKESMKNCTPEQKAACAKSGKDCSSHAKAGTGHGEGCDHSKADASETKEDKSGLK